MSKKSIIALVIGMALNILATQAQTTITGSDVLVDTLAIKDSLPKPIITSTWYAEAGGNALYYSLNYEKVLVTKPKYRLALRGGFGANPITKETFYPVELNYYRGEKNDYLELGMGFTPSVAEWKVVNFKGTLERNFQGITTLRIGYRYISTNQRIVIRVGVLLMWRSVFVTDHQTRVFFYEKRDYYDKATIWDGLGQSIVPWFGVSVGYNLFKR